MSEKVKIENASIGGEEIPRVEAEEQNEMGGMTAEAGFATMGEVGAPPHWRMPEAQLGNFLQRLTTIGSFALATTDVAFASVGVAVDPWISFLADPVIAKKTYNYAFFRGTLEVEISVNVPAGCYGLYYLVAIPLGSSEFNFDNINEFNIFSVQCVPHVAIDVASSTKGKLVLPWLGWMDYLAVGDGTTTYGPVGMYRLELICFLPIAQGSGATTPAGTISLYAKCADDAELVVSYQQGKEVPAAVQSLRSSVNGAVERVTGGVRASGVAAGVARVAGAVSKVPIIGAMAAPVAAGAAAVSSVLSFFGFTRETAQAAPTPVVDRPFSNVANMDGRDTSEVAALSVGNTLSIDPRLAGEPGGEDEAAFDYLTQKWVFVASFPWTLAAAKGDEIGYVPVSPFYAYNKTNQGAVFPMGGYLGLPFTYWRADMEYKLVIPMSKFHRGTLQVSWAPQSSATLDPTNNQYNHIFDVGAGQEWVFRVGYAVIQPALESFPLSLQDAIVSTAGANGALRLGVVNPLKAQVATANTEIFIFARVCPGAQYSVPRTVWNPLDSEDNRVTADFASTVTLQGGALGDEVVETHYVSLVPTTGRYPCKEVHFGEEILSARALAQKFSKDVNYSRAFAVAGARTLLTTHFPPPPSEYQHIAYYPSPPSSSPYPICFTWFGWYAALFVGAAGSVRYKVVNTAVDPAVVGAWAGNTIGGTNVENGLLGSTIGQVAPAWVVRTGEAVEVTIPFYYNRNYLPTFGRRSVRDIAQGSIPGKVNCLKVPQVRENSTESNPSTVVYTAGGPDLRFFHARFPPRVLYLAGASTPKYGNAPYVAP